MVNTVDFDLTPAIISLKTSLTSTVFTFIIGLFAAWKVANYKGKLKGVIDGFLTLSLVMPPIVSGFAVLFFVGKKGPLGDLLDKLDTRIIFTWQATVIAAVVVSFPLMYVTAKGAFEQIDHNILNAARTLGSSETRVFWRVAVPLAWPGIAAATVLSFARALGEFGATVFVSGNIPGKTQTIPLALYFAVESGNYNAAYIWVLAIFIISLLAMVLVNLLSRNKKIIVRA